MGVPDALDEDPRIEDLEPATLLALATRLEHSVGFAERVYRECELDALFTLADLATRMARLDGDGSPTSNGLRHAEALRRAVTASHHAFTSGDPATAALHLREGAFYARSEPL
jgi:hypothetical protein